MRLVDRRAVGVFMVFVMNMFMLVRKRFVRVRVLVASG
jgi:hypothetical protein